MIVHCSICICRKFFFFICRIMNFYIYLFIYIYISIVYGTFFCSLIIGCCFVTFFTRKAALNAQDALHNVKTLAGVSIIASIFSLYIYICLSICPSIYSFILFLVVFDPFRNLFTLDFLSPNHSVLHILFVHNTSFLFNQDKSLYIYILYVCLRTYVYPSFCEFELECANALVCVCPSNEIVTFILIELTVEFLYCKCIIESALNQKAWPKKQQQQHYQMLL